jgi:hypothetical protein
VDAASPALRQKVRLRLSQECERLNRMRPFKKIFTEDSHREDGLQLADMVAGAVRQYVVNGESSLYQSFEKRMVDLWRIA